MPRKDQKIQGRTDRSQDCGQKPREQDRLVIPADLQSFPHHALCLPAGELNADERNKHHRGHDHLPDGAAPVPVQHRNRNLNDIGNAERVCQILDHLRLVEFYSLHFGSSFGWGLTPLQNCYVT